mmetsp:Transcript_43349/g.41762  ORF Transcript_43349/g.41762 Transcript_43349/m.41762 type:complete len:163 (+) Transcript_43349:2342-2830(+)
MLQTLHEKVILNPKLQKNFQLAQKAFNCLKNALFNQPFDIDLKNQNYIRKLFSDTIFWLTFENIAVYQFSLPAKDQQDSLHEEADISDDNLEAFCGICVTSLSDIFIYYISHLKESYEKIEEKEAEQEEDFQALFTYLWLNYLKILLQFIEKSSNKDFHHLI